MEDTLLAVFEGEKPFTYHSDADDDIRLLRAQELRELGFIAKADELESELNKQIKLSRIANENYIAITPEIIMAFLHKKADKYNREHAKKQKKMADDISVQAARLLEILESQMQGSWHLPGSIVPTPSLGNYDGIRIIDDDIRDLPMNTIDSYLEHLERPSEESARILVSRRMPDPYSSYYNSLVNRHWSDLRTPNSYSGFVVDTCDRLSTKENTIGQYAWEEVPIATYNGIPPENVLLVLKEQKEKELFDDFTIASVESIKDPLLLGRVNGVQERFFLAQWGSDVTLDDII